MEKQTEIQKEILENPTIWQELYLDTRALHRSRRQLLLVGVPFLLIIIWVTLVTIFLSFYLGNVEDFGSKRSFFSLSIAWLRTSMISITTIIVVIAYLFRSAQVFVSDLYNPSATIKDETNKQIWHRLIGWHGFFEFRNYMVVNDTKLVPPDHWSTWLGGPVYLIIFDGFAVYLERGNCFSRVVGAGFPIPYLDARETIKAIVDLRPQIREGSISTYTKDGISIKMNIRGEFQIGTVTYPGSVDVNLLYAFDPLAVRRAVEYTALRVQDGKLVESDWCEGVMGKIVGTLSHYISSSYPDELFSDGANRILSHKVLADILKQLNTDLSYIGVKMLDLQIIEVTLPKETLKKIPKKSRVDSSKDIFTDAIKPFRQSVEIGHPTKDSVFISYGRNDWEKYVMILVERLTASGIKVWVDQYLLQGGDDWLDKITEALEKCNRMILCVTPSALQSKYVKMEYRYFFHRHKLLVPLVCEKTQLPAELEGIQYLDYGDFDSLLHLFQK